MLGEASGRTTLGHRFLGKGTIALARADDYEKRSSSATARSSRTSRRRAHKIRQELEAPPPATASMAAEDALLDEVTALVEFPAVYEAHFEQAFLEVPQECLMLSMKQHQKYFPLVDARGKLPPGSSSCPTWRSPHPRHIVARQRARAAGAARRREVLLRPGPAQPARVARAAARGRGLPQQARQPARSRGPHPAPGGRSSQRRSARTRLRRDAPPGSRRPTC